MSTRVIVNPGHFTVGGRLHPGTATAREEEARQAFSRSKALETAGDQSTPAPKAKRSAPAKTPARAAAARGRVRSTPR